MSGPGDTYRVGDVRCALGPLRLTVGGLAEIAARLDAPGPSDLAAGIRRMGPETARHLLTVLLRPCGRAGQVARLHDTDVAALMPDLSRCIVQALQLQPSEADT